MKPLFLILQITALLFAGNISIQADKALYIIGEPVCLSLISSGDTYVPDLECGDIALMIKKENSPAIAYGPSMIIDGPTCIGSSDNRTEDEIVIVSGNRLVFENAGEYQLYLVETQRSSSQISNKLKIVFRDPITVDEENAVKLIKEAPAEYGLFIYLNGGDHLKKGRQIAEEIATLTSAHRHVARATLSANYAQSFHDYATKKAREIDLPLALSYSECFDEDCPLPIRCRNASMLRYGKEQILKSSVKDDKNLKAIDGIQQHIDVVARHTKK